MNAQQLAQKVELEFMKFYESVPVLATIAEKASEKGWSALLLGGAVRSMALGLEIADFDIVVYNKDAGEYNYKDISDLAEQSGLPESYRFTYLDGESFDCDGIKIDIWMTKKPHEETVRSTFLDVNAMGIDILSGRAIVTEVAAGSILSKTIDINSMNSATGNGKESSNRIVSIAFRTEFKLSRRAIHYVLSRGTDLTEEALLIIRRSIANHG